MDAASLSALLSESTSSLTALHHKLGAPQEALAATLEELRNALQAAVDAQLKKCRLDVQERESKCRQLELEITELREALGMETTFKSSADQPLIPRLHGLDAQVHELRREHDARTAHALSLQGRLWAYTPLLDAYMPTIPAKPKRSKSRRSPRHSNAAMRESDGGSSSFDYLPASYLADLAKSLKAAEQEHTNRTEELREHLLAILHQWSELCIMPTLEDACGQPTFESRILSHLRLKVTMPDEGEVWEGAFESISEVEDDTLSPSATPTSGSLGGSSSMQPSHVLPPKPDNVKRAFELRQGLEAERVRREARIQELYDELFVLWERFGVTEPEMEEFVLANSGTTNASIQAYVTELGSMRELKAQNMAAFIGGIRERIAKLWDELAMSTAERRAAFPSFFVDLDDGLGSGISPTDELQEAHDAYERIALQELERKAPLLKMVGRYQDLIAEGEALEKAAQDPQRLKKTRPGQLLEEEKVRKRVKVLKPKLEDELLRIIPGWEEETGRSFMIDGQRFVEKLQSAAAAQATASTRKRTRTISTSSTASDSCPPLSSSSAANRVAATPMRAASSAKRARLGSSVGLSGAASVRATPATATRRGPTINSAASSIARPVASTNHASSRIASSSRIPAVAPSSPTQNRQGMMQKTGHAFASDSKSASRPSFRAQHTFRPRPSAAGTTFLGGASALSGNMNEGRWASSTEPSSVLAGQASEMGMPRSASDQSIAASEGTVVFHRPSVDTAAADGRCASKTRNRGPRPSSAVVNNLGSKSKYARPSVGGLGDAPSIRTVSSERSSYRIPSGGAFAPAGPNWAVLDEDEEDVFDGHSQGAGAGAVPQNV